MMHIDYAEILKQLEPYKDKVFFLPMEGSEIDELERRVNCKFPRYFRDFLVTFGLKQDVVWGILESENDFERAANILPDEVRELYVQIGDNGGEDVWLLNTSDHADLNIYEYEHWKEGAIVALDMNFNTLISNGTEGDNPLK